MTTHMMIDCETLGTGDRPALLQVGLVTFDPMGDGTATPMEWTLDSDDSVRLGGRVEGATVRWWLSRPEAARASVSREPEGSLTECLLAVHRAYSVNGCSRVWCHGATFDVPILDGYHRRAGLGELAWRFHHVRDTRTLFELAEGVAGWERPRAEVAHTALADARQQALDVQGALRALRALVTLT